MRKFEVTIHDNGTVLVAEEKGLLQPATSIHAGSWVAVALVGLLTDALEVYRREAGR